MNEKSFLNHLKIFIDIFLTCALQVTIQNKHIDNSFLGCSKINHWKCMIMKNKNNDRKYKETRQILNHFVICKINAENTQHC